MTKQQCEQLGEVIGWAFWVVIAATVHSWWGWSGVVGLLATPFVLAAALQVARRVLGEARPEEAEAGA